MIQLKGIHHIAIICSDYERSKEFYTDTLGFRVQAEHYRKERKSYKTDLILNNTHVVELFSFPDPPKRPSRPEACGLRHLAFAVGDIQQAVIELGKRKVEVEAIRTDEFTGKKFTFFADPDGLPLELYEL